MDELIKSIRGADTYLNLQVANATLSILRSVPSRVHAVNIGMVSCPTLTLYDNASGASGTIIASFDAGATPHCYIVDLPALNGITAWVTIGKVPQINIAAR